MKSYNVETPNLSNKIEPDDEITGVYTKGKYTHNAFTGEKLFLMFYLVNNEWECQSHYSVGLSSVINEINGRDLELLKLNVK